MQKHLATFLSAAMLFSGAAQDKGTKTSSIPVSVVVTQEKATGAKTILDTLDEVADSLVLHLRLPVDSKGIRKSPIKGNVKRHSSPSARCRHVFVSAFSPTV
jgi:hypothetical protein